MADRNKGGRESEYKPEYAREARRRCASGAIQRELAESWGVTGQTVRNWKKTFPELKAAIDEGAAEAKTRRKAGGLEVRRRAKAQPRRFDRAEIIYVRP
jgi:hypothetical protein